MEAAAEIVGVEEEALDGGSRRDGSISSSAIAADPPNSFLTRSLELTGADSCRLVVIPKGVVTVIVVTPPSAVALEEETEHSILYPGGRNVLNPTIKFGCPRNRVDTRSITPGVSMPWDLNSFIIVRN